jgi:hypothetical protein
VRRGALLALALFTAAHAAGAATPAARLADAERRYASHLLADRPDLASREGARRADGRLEPVTEATLQRDAGLLAALADSLAAIDGATLGARDRARLDTLRVRVAHEREPLVSGAWRCDPSRYLALAVDAPLASARRPRTSACDRARLATGRLRMVPEVLRAAQVNLEGAAIGDREAAAAPWRGAMQVLRDSLPDLFSDCREPERFARFVEADTLALEAMGRFTRFLLEAPAAPRAPAGGR